MKIKGYRLFKVDPETNKMDQLNISRHNCYWCINGDSREVFRELNHALKHYLAEGWIFNNGSVVLENDTFMSTKKD